MLTVSDNTVSLTVKNTGAFAGAEVVQLYIGAPQDGEHHPIRELMGFQKVFLQPEENKTIMFQLTNRSFALWRNGWKVPAGQYAVSIGGLIAAIERYGEALPIPPWRTDGWYQTCARNPNQKDWETMLYVLYCAVFWFFWPR